MVVSSLAGFSQPPIGGGVNRQTRCLAEMVYCRNNAWPIALVMCDSSAYSAHNHCGEADMTMTRPIPGAKSRVRTRRVNTLGQARGPNPLHASILKEAQNAGLLTGEKTEHVSFRAPPALVEAAKREAGISSTSELGVLALAMLARPDPVAVFFRRTEGRLGPHHDLDT
jgi:hypothetical protein